MIILLVEDNETISKGLTYSLEKNGHRVVCLMSVSDVKIYLTGKLPFSSIGGNGAEAPEKPDFIILDVALPDGDGFRLFETLIRDLGIPTIFLTAKDEEEDIVRGLNMGAEDYITKPFSTKELLARMNRIMLRMEKKNVLRVKDIAFDLDKMTVYKGSETLALSSLELKILHLLFLNCNHVVSRNTLLDKIWEWTGNDVDDHTVTVYLRRIREKLGTDIIVTVKGVGYRIDVEK